MSKSIFNMLWILMLIKNPFGAYLLILSKLRTGINAKVFVDLIFLITYITFLNKAVFGKPLAWDFVRVVLLLSLSSAFVYSNLDKLRSNSLVLSLFCLALILHSLFLSKSPEISFLKSFSFTLMVIGLILAVKEFNLNLQSTLHSAKVLLYVSIVLVLLGFGNVTYESEYGSDTFVTGAFKHPNALGVILVPASVWIWAKIISMASYRVPSKLLIGLGYILLFLFSGTRGALFSVVLAILFALLVKGKFKFLAASALVILGLSFVLNFSFLQSFVAKGAESITSIEDLGQERYRRIIVMLDNIEKYPLTGIGLGIHSDFDSWLYSDRVKRDPYFGIPYSASVEKGTFFIAIFEELGIPLAIFFFVVLIKLFMTVLKFNSIPRIAMFTSCVLLNFSESVFLSVNGVGPILWGYIFLSTYGKD